MDDPPAKRRRTSPRNAATVAPAESPTAASSAMQPAETEPTSARMDSEPRRRRAPPSFASPTKASLSRHNPEILTRRRTPRGSTADAQPTDTPTETPPVIQPPSASSQVTPSAKPRRTLRSETIPEEQAEDQADDGDLTSGGVTVPSSARSLARRSLGGGLATKPKRTPRPLPSRGPEADEDILDPAPSRARHLARAGGVPATASVAEPELPPTPVERGLDDPVVTTPPKGIHSSSPSRRAAQKIKSAKMKSSPLKQPPLRPKDLPVRPAANVQDDTLRVRLGLAAAAPKRQTHPARNVQSADPAARQRRIRDALRTEVAALEADLELVTAENERLRKKQNARRPATENDGLSLDDDELLRIIRTYLLPPAAEKEAAPPEKRLLAAALNPIAWLPFGKPEVTSLADEEDELESLPQPRSHHPIAMTAEEELPYLQAFTPLSFSSVINVLPRAKKTDPLLQKHTFTIRSAKPPGVFSARMEMTVNAKHLTITELAVPRLDPAAIDELGSFVDGLLRTPSSSALTRNVSVVSWAMGEWVRVAVRRARFWLLLEAETGTEEKLLGTVARMRSKSRKRRRRDDDEEEEGEGDDAREAAKGKEAPDRSALLVHMGRTAMDIPLPAGNGEQSWLRVQWRIEFDWSGEARSKVAAMVGLPGKWRHHDQRGDLARIPGIFDRLVDGEDPMSAVQSVLALLAGEVQQ